MASLNGTSSAAPPSTSPPVNTSITADANVGGVLRKSSLKKVNQSPKGRIDSILEGARAREVAMGGNNENGASRARGDSESPGGGRDTRDTESSADEETNIIRRSSTSMNYQGTAQQRKATRSQPSTATIRKDGRVYDAGAERNEEEEAGEHQGWWARLLSDYGSIELENKGSVARDHLALERTFLAWLRTSLAFASIGIAITQLFRLNTTSVGSGGHDPYFKLRQMGKPLGATFLGISIVMLFIGFHRYFESQHWIIRGKFPASRGSIALVAAITFALMITSLVVVVVVEPKAFEKR